jgi:hypothetical protein
VVGDGGYGILDTGYWILDTGYWISKTLIIYNSLCMLDFKPLCTLWFHLFAFFNHKEHKDFHKGHEERLTTALKELVTEL